MKSNTHTPFDAIITIPLAIAGSDDGKIRLLCNEVLTTESQIITVSGKGYSNASFLKGKPRTSTLYPYFQPFETSAVKEGLIHSNILDFKSMIDSVSLLIENGETVVLDEFNFEYTKASEINFTCSLQPENKQSDQWGALLALLEKRKAVLG